MSATAWIVIIFAVVWLSVLFVVVKRVIAQLMKGGRR